jgi:hypothetical protein
MKNYLPNSIEDLFKNEEAIYYYYSEDSMDNYYSMDWFIKYLELQDYIFQNEGTQIQIQHPKYNFQLQIDAGGCGDFFSHKFEVSVTQRTI